MMSWLKQEKNGQGKGAYPKRMVGHMLNFSVNMRYRIMKVV